MNEIRKYVQLIEQVESSNDIQNRLKKIESIAINLGKQFGDTNAREGGCGYFAIDLYMEIKKLNLHEDIEFAFFVDYAEDENELINGEPDVNHVTLTYFVDDLPSAKFIDVDGINSINDIMSNPFYESEIVHVLDPEKDMNKIGFIIRNQTAGFDDDREE